MAPITRAPSLIRPEDSESYAHDVSAKYNNRAMELESEEMSAREKAINSLRDALNNQAEVSPAQGIAAALLASLPALGGYMIGKSVGKPRIPEGTYFPGLKPDEFNKEFGSSGAMAGGAQGAAIGAAATDDYFTRMQDAVNRSIPIKKDIAGLEAQEANRLGTEANKARESSLDLEAQAARDIANQNFQKELIPIREASEVRIANAKRDADNQALKDPLVVSGLAKQSRGVPLSEEESVAIAKAGMGVYTASNAAAGRYAYQQAVQTNISGTKKSPPTQKTKDLVANALAANTLIDKYEGQLEAIAAQEPSYLNINIEKVLPATMIGSLQKELGLFAVQIRNARESGVMTESDYQRYNSYLTIGPLDTLESVLARFKSLRDVTKRMATAGLTAAKQGGERTEGFEDLLGVAIPDYFPGSKNKTPTTSDAKAELDKKIAELEAQIQGTP